jgi:hypothetical protein
MLSFEILTADDTVIYYADCEDKTFSMSFILTYLESLHNVAVVYYVKFSDGTVVNSYELEEILKLLVRTGTSRAANNIVFSMLFGKAFYDHNTRYNAKLLSDLAECKKSKATLLSIVGHKNPVRKTFARY